MIDIKCLLLGHKHPSKNSTSIKTGLKCKRCNALIKKPVVRYCIREQRRNYFVAACNVSNLSATGVSYKQAHNRFFAVLGDHFNLDVENEISAILDMKIK